MRQTSPVDPIENDKSYSEINSFSNGTDDVAPPKKHNTRLDFVIVLVATFGLVASMTLVQTRQLFHQQAKSDGEKVKKEFVIPDNGKKIGKNMYDLGEFTHDDGRKMQRVMVVDYFDQKEDVLGAATEGEVLQSATNPCVLYNYTASGAPFKINDGATNYYFDADNSSGLTTQQIYNTIDVSSKKWENASGQPDLFDNIISAQIPFDPAHPTRPNWINEIYFADLHVTETNDPHNVDKASYALGLAFYSYDILGNVTEVDIILNDLYKYTLTNEPGKIDLEGVLTHEIGHAVGLGDITADQCKNQTVMSTGGRTLYPTDVEAVRKLYNGEVPNSTPSPVITSNLLVDYADNVNYFPKADAFVHKDYPNANYGSRTTLQIDGNPVKLSLMKFDFSTYGNLIVNTAKLKFYVTSSSSSTQSIKTIGTNSWAEGTVTYNTKPAFGGQIGTISGAVAGTWKEVDLTSFVKQNIGKVVSIGIDSTGSDGLDFYSKEASVGYRPYIQIK